MSRTLRVNRGPVVVDTNVVISGLLTRDPDAPTAQILDAMLSGHLRFLLSQELLAEYRIVALRPKIRNVHRLGEDSIDQLLVELALNGILRESTPSATLQETQQGDQNDLHLWALVQTLPGTILITGDRELADVAPAGVIVQSPRDYVG